MKNNLKYFITVLKFCKSTLYFVERSTSNYKLMHNSKFRIFSDSLVLFVCLFMFAIYYYYGLSPDLSYPLAYTGDCISWHTLIRIMLLEGWYSDTTQLLGAPFIVLSDVPPPGFSVMTMMKLLLLSSNNVIIAINIYMLLSFSVNGISAFVACRWLNVGRMTSFTIAFLYAFLPYHMFRAEMHHVLLWTWSVPLTVAVATKIIFTPQSIFSQRLFLPQPFVVILFLCVGTCNFYYVAFSILVILCVSIYSSFYNRTWRILLSCCILCLLMSLPLFFDYAMYMLRIRESGGLGSYYDLEMLNNLALNISYMILPHAGHRLPLLDGFISRFTNAAPPVFAEYTLVSLGFIGSLGLVCLFFFLFMPLRSTDKRIHFNAALACFLILFFCVGGFNFLLNFIFSYFTAPYLRAGNRICLYIAFLSLLGLGYLSTPFERRVVRKNLCALCAAVIIFFGYFEQTPLYPHGLMKEYFNSDQMFIQEIEKIVPRSGMIAQYPILNEAWMPSRGFPTYGHTASLLFSETLRWSSSLTVNRQIIAYREVMPHLSMQKQITILQLLGFSGLVVDHRAYGDYGAAMVDVCTTLLNSAPLFSKDGTKSFFKLNPSLSPVTFDSLLPLIQHEAATGEFFNSRYIISDPPAFLEGQIQYSGAWKTNVKNKDKFASNGKARLQFLLSEPPSLSMVLHLRAALWFAAAQEEKRNLVIICNNREIFRKAVYDSEFVHGGFLLPDNALVAGENEVELVIDYTATGNAQDVAERPLIVVDPFINIQPVPSIPENTTLPTSAFSYGNVFLTRGWEEWNVREGDRPIRANGRWSVDNSVQLAFRVTAKTNEKHRLVLKLGAVRLPMEKSAIPLSVAVNGQIMPSVTLTEETGEIIVSLPDILPEDGTISVVLRMPEVSSETGHPQLYVTSVCLVGNIEHMP